MKAAKTVMTSGDVARICKVSPQTVNKWYRSKRLQGRTIPGSRHRRFQSTDVVRFMKEHNMPLRELEESKARVVLVNLALLLLREIVNSDVLHQEEYEVTDVHSLFDAGMAIGERPPGCVVIDMSIGVDQSVAIAKSVRTKSPNCAVICLLDRSTILREEERSVFTGLFYDPFDPALLVERIARLARQPVSVG